MPQVMRERFRSLSRFAGVASIFIGSMALAGWFFDVPALKSVLPGNVSMKANTAACFLLAGTSLWLLQDERGITPRRASLGRQLALLVFSVGTLTLAQDLFAFDLGLDQWLVRAPADAPQTSSPGRMAPVAALCFSLVGMALALLNAKRSPQQRMAALLAGLALLAGFVGTTGYMLSVSALYGVAGFTSMAIHTAVGFLVLPIGILLARPERGIVATLAQETPSGTAIRRLLPLVFAIPMLAGWICLEGQQRGYYDGGFAVGIMVTLCTTSFGALAVWSAHVQGDSERAEQQSHRDEKFLIGVGELLRKASDVDDVLAGVSTSLGQYLDASRCLFLEITADAQEAVVRSDYHHGLPSIAGRRPLPAPSPDAVEGSRTGQAVVNNDTSVNERTAALYERFYRPAQIRSSVSVPLLRDSQWVATLLTSTHFERTWEPREVTLIQVVAERTWQWVERLAAQEALAQRELDLQVTMNSIGDAIIATDNEECVVRMNPGAEALTGWQVDEAKGRPLSEVIAMLDDETRAPLESPAAGVLREGKAVVGSDHAWLVARDGSERSVSGNCAPIRDADGTLRGVVLVLRDTSLARATQLSLKASVKEREVLLQEVHHRVKNNLQVIASLINMQVRQISDVSTRGALAECQSRVLAISLIHEKLYQSKDYARVPFSEYARSLAANIFHATGISPGAVSLDLNIEPFALAVDKAIPCGLILNELISNALKHAFPNERSGMVRVGLRMASEHEVLLSVADDGVGLSEGFDIETSSSLGMQLVATLVEQLDGQVDIRQTDGTVFSISFPVEA